MTERGLGHVPDLPDARDELHGFDRLNLARVVLPALIGSMLDHYQEQDQQRTNSCTGQGARQGLRIYQIANFGHIEIDPSALAAYKLGQAFHPGLIGTDSGGHIRSVFRSFNEYGIVSNDLFPWDQSKAKEGKPGKIAMGTAYKSRQGRYRRHFSSGDRLLDDLQLSLLHLRPFEFGVPVYRPFLDSRGPDHILAPVAGDEPVGWHAMCAYASKRDSEGLWFRIGNSWGDWRDGGSAWLHSSYMLLAVDKWSIELVENEP